MFTKAVVSDSGCFWQENSVLGTFGAGMGISTWWYRGSDMDTERTLETRAGRTLTELSIDGNKGFRAADSNVCSIYVTKGELKRAAYDYRKALTLIRDPSHIEEIQARIADLGPLEPEPAPAIERNNGVPMKENKEQRPKAALEKVAGGIVE